MSITIVSTTSTPEQVTAALGSAKPETPVKENKSAISEDQKPHESKPTEDPDTSDEVNADNDDEDSDENQGADDSAPPKKKGGFQRKIDKVTKQKAELARERDYWREQAMKSGKSDSPVKPETESKPVEAKIPGEPDPNDFETQADYVRALTKFELKVEREAKEALEKQAELKTRAEKTQKEFFSKLESFKEENSDFDDLVDSVEDVKAPYWVIDEFRESEIGPALMYELAKNRDEYERICQLDHKAAVRAIGRLEEKIISRSAAKETPTKKQTSAPAPLSPVKGKSGEGRKSLSDPNLTQAEYEALRAKQRS